MGYACKSQPVAVASDMKCMTPDQSRVNFPEPCSSPDGNQGLWGGHHAFSGSGDHAKLLIAVNVELFSVPQVPRITCKYREVLILLQLKIDRKTEVLT